VRKNESKRKTGSERTTQRTVKTTAEHAKEALLTNAFEFSEANRATENTEESTSALPSRRKAQTKCSQSKARRN
jgi:hypothetical protein